MRSCQLCVVFGRTESVKAPIKAERGSTSEADKQPER